MLKALAVLRTIFLVFIVGYTVRATPSIMFAKTFDEQYARCSESLAIAMRAAWLAVAWIALETAIGWFVATRRNKKPAPAATTPAP